MNTKLLLLLTTLLCLMFHTGCGTMNRRAAEKTLETRYTAQVAYENKFRLRVYSDSSPGIEETAFMSMTRGSTIDFWNEFEQYQTRYGRQAALALLAKIVQANGLCMLMASDYGQRMIGRTEASQLIKLGGDQQTRLYHFATTEDDFKIEPNFLKVEKQTTN